MRSYTQNMIGCYSSVGVFCSQASTLTALAALTQLQLIFTVRDGSHPILRDIALIPEHAQMLTQMTSLKSVMLLEFPQDAEEERDYLPGLLAALPSWFMSWGPNLRELAVTHTNLGLVATEAVLDHCHGLVR